MIETFLSQYWVQRLGWTLLHFLWQGTAVAAVYALVRGVAGRSLSSHGRYLLACLTLTTMATAPVLTFLLISRASLPAMPWIVATPSWQSLLPGFVAAWLTGVLAFSIRLLAGWRFTARLRSMSHPAPSEWQSTIERIAACVRTARPVRLLVSSLVDGPAVIGWLRPVILVPVECLTGMPLEHVTALLAHEMAHIRRNDYVASILQSIAEAVLFYHPAVWWVSGQIRAEREACCDDMAVAASGGDVLTYARALAQLESIQQPRLTMALAANTGSLIRRIRRLMEPTQAAAENYPGAGAAWAMTLLWMAGVGAATVHGAQTPVPMPRLVELGSAPHVQGPSPFVLPAIPAASLADHARDTLLFDPFLSAQVVQPAVPEPLDGDQRERKEAALRKELETPYRKWLDEDVAYIISSEERNAFWKLDTDDERDRFIEEFWLRRDPTPGTLENEAKAEHYRRIAYANENFGAALPGWRTDRGHVYIILGPPDEIQRFRFTYDPNGQRSDLPPQITWLYHSVAGVGDEVRLRFQDLAGTGEFRLSADQRDLLSGLHFARIDSPGRLPMQVRYDYFRGTPSSTLMNLTMQFAGKDLKFQMQDGLNKSAINVFGRVSSMTRRPISTFEPTLETSVLAGAGERANQLYQQSVPLAPGRYHLNIVAKDIMSGNMNVYEAALDVPHFDDDKMSTSSLVLADAIEKLPAKRDVGAMFAIGDDKVRPRLDGGFSNTEKMGVYLQVYNFAPDETQKPSGSVEFEVDKAASGEKIIDLSQDVAAIPNASASQVTIEKLLPLNALTPGAYTLTVTVTDKKRNQSVQQRENFTVTAQ